MISGPLCNTCCSMQKRSWFNSASNIHITYVLLKKMMLTIKAHNSGVISQELQKAAEILKDLSQDTPASESRLTGFLAFLLMLQAQAPATSNAPAEWPHVLHGLHDIATGTNMNSSNQLPVCSGPPEQAEPSPLEPAQTCPTTTHAKGFLPSARGGWIMGRSELRFELGGGSSYTK